MSLQYCLCQVLFWYFCFCWLWLHFFFWQLPTICSDIQFAFFCFFIYDSLYLYLPLTIFLHSSHYSCSLSMKIRTSKQFVMFFLNMEGIYSGSNFKIWLSLFFFFSLSWNMHEENLGWRYNMLHICIQYFFQMCIVLDEGNLLGNLFDIIRN